MRSTRPLILVALAGCGAQIDPEPQEPPPPAVAAFVPDVLDGPGLALEGELAAGRLTLALVAHDVEPLFGFRAWVRFGPEATLVEAVTEPVLDDRQTALYLVVPAADAVSLGGARRRPDQGDVAIDGPVARLVFDATEGARFDVDGVVAKRADGTTVALDAVGGTVLK